MCRMAIHGLSRPGMAASQHSSSSSVSSRTCAAGAARTTCDSSPATYPLLVQSWLSNPRFSNRLRDPTRKERFHIHLSLSLQKDTANTTRGRAMTFTSAERFLILDRAFPLRAVLSPADLHSACCCAVLAPRHLSHGEGPTFEPQSGWEDCDSHYASRMQRFGE